jgi:saccharopine dehydrogenase-like NADP-dependent oxidoreductase
MDSLPIKLANGLEVSPRALLHKALSDRLPQDQPDVVLIRVTVTGMKARKPVQVVWQCIDYNDEAQGLSAMMRMTAFPASVIAQMIARGDIAEHGVLRQELTVPVKLFLTELASRGITMTMTERAPAEVSK